MKKMEQNIQELRSKIKRCNIHEIGIPEEKRKQSRRNTWSNNGQEFSKIDDTKPQLQS